MIYMGIHEDLVARIDSLETDKSNESSPHDFSNRAHSAIEQEWEKLEELIERYGITSEGAKDIRDSYNRELAKTLADTHTEVLNEEEFYFLSYWFSNWHLDISIIERILTLFPDVSWKDVLELATYDYDLPFIYIENIKKIFPNIRFQDISSVIKTTDVHLWEIIEFKKIFPKAQFDELVTFLVKTSMRSHGLNILQEVFPSLSLDNLTELHRIDKYFTPNTLVWFKERFPEVTLEYMIKLLHTGISIRRLLWFIQKAAFNITLDDINNIVFNFSVDILLYLDKIPDIFPDINLWQVKELLRLRVNFTEIEKVKTLFPEISVEDIIMLYEDDQEIGFWFWDDFKSVFPNVSKNDMLRLHKKWVDLSGALWAKERMPEIISLNFIKQNPGLEYYLLPWIRTAFAEVAIERVIDFALKFPHFHGEWFDENAQKFSPQVQTIDDVEERMDTFTTIIPNIRNKKNPEYLFGDPAINIFYEIIDNNLLLQWSNEDKLIVARNIYFSWRQVSKAIVVEEYRLLCNERIKYEKRALFQGRNIVYAAHHENRPSSFIEEHNPRESERFWQRFVIDAIRNQWWALPEKSIFHPENNREDLIKKKEWTLKAISESKSPMTFIFDWHGSDEAIFFSDWEYIDGNKDVAEDDTSVKITFQELSQALIQKNRKHPSDEVDIFIIDSCSGHSFARNVYHELKIYNQWVGNMKLSYPIFISAWEYDQVTYSNFASDQWWDFFGEVLNIWVNYKYWISFFDNEHITTVWDIFDNQELIIHAEERPSNPSVFIPREDKKWPMQISYLDAWRRSA